MNQIFSSNPVLGFTLTHPVLTAGLCLYRLQKDPSVRNSHSVFSVTTVIVHLSLGQNDHHALWCRSGFLCSMRKGLHCSA